MNVEIKRIKLKSDAYTLAEYYPAPGIYHVEITDEPELANQLIMVSYCGGANLLWVLGLASDLLDYITDTSVKTDKAISDLKLEVKEVQVENTDLKETMLTLVNKEPMTVVDVVPQISESLFLNALSVALHKKKL